MRDEGEEVERREVTGLVQEGIEVRCLGCGRHFALYETHDGLDWKVCCGFEYALEHVRTDFVVTVKP